MKVPHGYGQVYISFPPQSQPDGIGRGMVMNVDTDSSNYTPIEVADIWLTLAKNKEKDIYGYHFNWDLTLIDEDLTGSSNQDDLCNFLYYYYRSIAKDKAFNFVPYYSSNGNYTTWLAQNVNNIFFTVITSEEPRLENMVAGTRVKGQKLRLKIETKNMLPEDSYNFFIYRDTTTDNWGTLPTSGTQTLGSSSTAGATTPTGMLMDNLIKAANDTSFLSGNIGNWIVYSDGDGTCTYIADTPAASDKVGKVLVGNGGAAGTYTGASLPTTAIDTFTNGSTYKIQARIYIPSATNNFSRISILPVNLTGWTKISETTATLTTEDSWQIINAVYTAAADVTGNIVIKGESTTDGDIFYFDDIQIYNY